MVALRPLYCLGIAVFLSALTSPAVLAQPSATRSPRTTEMSRGNSPADPPAPERERAGNPIMGVMIIILMVGFLVFVAWIFSRVGSGQSRSSDNTLD